MLAALANDLAPGALALTGCGMALVGEPRERAARLLRLFPLLLLRFADYWTPVDAGLCIRRNWRLPAVRNIGWIASRGARAIAPDRAPSGPACKKNIPRN